MEKNSEACRVGCSKLEVVLVLERTPGLGSRGPGFH